MTNYTVDYYKCSDIQGGVQTFFKQLSEVLPDTKNISVTDACKHFDISYMDLLKMGGLEFLASLLIDRYLHELNDVELIIRNSICGNFLKHEAPMIAVLNDNNVAGPELFMKHNLITKLHHHFNRYCCNQLTLETLKRASKVVAVSKSIADDYKKEYGVKSVVIHHGVDTNVFKPFSNDKRRVLREDLGIPLTKPVCLWVGGIHPLKGLAKVINPLVKVRKDIHFIMVIKDKGSFKGPDNVTLFSDLSHERMPGIYNLADFTIISSLIESFSLVAIESMACGVPIIMQRTGIASDWKPLGDYGLIVNDWNTNAYNIAIDNLLNHAFNPRKAIFDKELTIERFKKEWLELIEEVKS